MARLIQLLGFAVVVCIWGCSSVAPPAYNFPDGVARRSGRIALIGDIQRRGSIEFFREDNGSDQAQLVGQLATEDLDAMFLLGDLTFWGSMHNDWMYVDDLLHPFQSKQLPIFPLMGNHEYFIPGFDASKNISDRFKGFDTTWYVRVVDSTAFVILNSNANEIGTKEMNAQWKWFKSSMKSLDVNPSVRAVVVCSHHPPFTNSKTVHGDSVMRKYFVPTFNNTDKALVWFSGHCHSYERIDQGGKTFVVSGGGGGPRQELENSSKREFEDSYVCSGKRPLHYCVLERDGDQLSVSMVPLKSNNGELADQFKVGVPQQLVSNGSTK